MRKLLVLIGAVAAVAVPGATAAKMVPVSIPKNGYVPQAVTITVGVVTCARSLAVAMPFASRVPSTVGL